MNKYLTIIVSSLVGILIGATFSYFYKSNDKVEVLVETEPEQIVVKQKVVDTVVLEKKVYIDTTSQNVSLTDTVLSATDTLDGGQQHLNEEFHSSGSNRTSIGEDDDDDEIITERMVAKRTVVIQVAKTDTLSADEAFKLRTESFADQLVIEFWESPLELTGYELSRARLKLFGFDSNVDVRVQRQYDGDFLMVTLGQVSLKLDKTTRFKTLYP